jgi:hypothetical protein
METFALFAILSLLSETTPSESLEVLQYRFPPREVAKEAMNFNRAYRLHLVSRQVYELHNFWDIQDAITETDYLYHCWDWLHAAQKGEGRDEKYWMTSFMELKKRIGEEQFRLGIMPPNVPYNRFSYAN